MHITESQLQQIINEELTNLLSEQWWRRKTRKTRTPKKGWRQRWGRPKKRASKQKTGIPPSAITDAQTTAGVQAVGGTYVPRARPRAPVPASQRSRVMRIQALDWLRGEHPNLEAGLIARDPARLEQRFVPGISVPADRTGIPRYHYASWVNDPMHVPHTSGTDPFDIERWTGTVRPVDSSQYVFDLADPPVIRTLPVDPVSTANERAIETLRRVRGPHLTRAELDRVRRTGRTPGDAARFFRSDRVFPYDKISMDALDTIRKRYGGKYNLTGDVGTRWRGEGGLYPEGIHWPAPFGQRHPTTGLPKIHGKTPSLEHWGDVLMDEIRRRLAHPEPRQVMVPLSAAEAREQLRPRTPVSGGGRRPMEAGPIPRVGRREGWERFRSIQPLEQAGWVRTPGRQYVPGPPSFSLATPRESGPIGAPGRSSEWVPEWDPTPWR